MLYHTSKVDEALGIWEQVLYLGDERICMKILSQLEQIHSQFKDQFFLARIQITYERAYEGILMTYI